jgi:siroheme synthase-like protein
MGYFPFFIDIGGKEILVVGGGKVALRKIEKLLHFQPAITVTAPEICGEIRAMNVKIALRKFRESDLNGKFCVISATDDERLNARIYDLCTERNILVNTVDDKAKCSFVFPALSTADDVTVGISTGGKSPMFARYLRRRTDGLLDGKTLETTEILGSYRPIIKRLFGDEESRKKANGALLELCLKSESLPDDNQIIKMLEDRRLEFETND